MNQMSRLTRRVFRRVVGATGPVPLDLDGVSAADAYRAIHEAGGLVRCTDAASPLEALYVVVSGAEGCFAPTRVDRILNYLRRIFR
jgi:hypothetical protein